VSDSPEEVEAVTVDADEAPELEGFEAAVAAIGNPLEQHGQPEQTEAVEDSEVTETPKAEDAEKADDAPAEATEETDAEPEINFDGFSDAQKATFGRLLEAGHVTKEEVETARLESMFQSAFTKKTMTLADERKAWETQQGEVKEDLDLLARLREDDATYAAWEKLRTEGVDSAEAEDGDDLVDKRTAERIADERVEKRLAEISARSAKEQQVYDEKTKAISLAAQESMKLLGVDADVMKGYLEAEEATMPAGIDPILHLAPEELQRRVAARHESVSKDAEIADLRKQLKKRTSKDERTSKQSLSPSPRVSERPANPDALQQTEEELGLASDWSNVDGFGFVKEA